VKLSDLSKPLNRNARIELLSLLPVFLDMHGKLVVGVGESEGATWKAGLLLQSGATLKLICQRPGAAMLQLVSNSITRRNCYSKIGAAQDEPSGRELSFLWSDKVS
jgi:siroheme synthase (precorrin-2 oxidase/ferrochelatase)